MKILFICSSLEPGLDGVGDYTRLLAAELIKFGHFVAVLSINDKHVSGQFNGVQLSGKTDVSVLRLPSSENIKQRLQTAKKYIDDFDPDWLSLQFVIFGYHPKGLPFGMGRQLAFIGGERRWHIMFHEIWQGESKSDTLKQRIIGAIQKQIVKGIAKNVKATHYTTSNNYYCGVLFKNNINAVQQHVFSNIPKGKQSGRKLVNRLPLEVLNNRGDYIIGSFFGSMHLDESFFIAFEKLQHLVKQAGKKLVVTHIGNADQAKKLLEYLGTSADNYFVAFEYQSGQDIADYFCHIEIGLSTNPKILVEKSGSVAAMLNNGLPVVLLRKGFEPDTRKIKYIKEINEIEKLADFADQEKDFKDDYSVAHVAESFMALLNNH